MAQLKTQNSKLKTKIRWLFAALILAIVLSLFFTLAGRVLRQIAIAQLTELIGAKIQAESIDFKLNGSVLIKKLVIRPYKKQSDDDAILEAETVYARFGKVSLLLLRPRLKEIYVNDFVFNAQYNLDTKRWNVAALKIKPPKRGSGQIPLVHLERGKLQYSKVSNGQVEVVAEVPLRFRFGPARLRLALPRRAEETQDAYSFEIATARLAGGSNKSRLTGFWKPGSITFAGGISSADIPALEMAWIIEVLAAELKYDRNKDYSLKLTINDFHSKHSPSLDKLALVASSFLQLVGAKPAAARKSGLFTALQRFFNRYRPAGCIDINLEASGNLNRLRESALAGEIYCKDASICDRKFQYAIENLTGQIDFTKKSVLLNNLSGQHGDVKLFFNGFSRDFGPNFKYDIRMTSDNMVLDNDLYNALSEKQKEFWSAFSPTGQVAIDYRLSRQSPTDKKRTLVVELLGTEATYKHFPYPLKNLTGKLFFDRDGITFSNVVSQVDERKIVINGKAITAGTDRPIYDVTIDVNNIPLDSTLESALPDVQRELYAQWRPAGLADGEIKIFTPKQDVSTATFIADLSFRNSSLDSAQIPLAVSDISAKAVFTDDLIRIDSFTGRHAEGLLSLTGQVWPGQEDRQLRYRLTLNGQHAQLNNQLFNLLPKPLQKIVSEFQPKGKVNYNADLNKTDPDDYPDYNITVACLDNSINFQRFAYPLKDITGNLTITKDSIELRDIAATAADSLRIEPNSSTIKLSGEIVLADNVFSSGQFRVSAKNILFDERLGIALPESHKGFYSQLSPTGRFDVNPASVKISTTDDGKKYIDFDGAVKFKDCNFNAPVAITELDAELKTKGLYKTGEGFQRGQAILCADSLRIKDKAFTKLEADIYYDSDQQNWFTENLVADCYGGRLTGKLEFTQPAEVSSEYLLQVAFDNVDIKQFLSDSSTAILAVSSRAGSPCYGDTSGRMSGSLSLSGQSGDSSSRIGRCRLAISDMQVGELSPLAKLLHVLKLTEPKDFAFDRMLVDSYIKHDILFFEKFDLSGAAIAFYGSGQMDLQSKNVELILTARGDRLTMADPSILQSLAEGLGVAVVRMEVTGNVYNPQVKTKTLPVIEDSLHILGTKELPPKS